MNLRVRSVTGRSAMFASCTFSLAKALHIENYTGRQTESLLLDIYAKAKSSRSSLIYVCGK